MAISVKTSMSVPQAKVAAPDPVVKTSMNLPQSELDALRAMATEANISMADMVRRALSTEKFVRETVARGAKVLIEEQDKTYKQVLFR